MHPELSPERLETRLNLSTLSTLGGMHYGTRDGLHGYSVARVVQHASQVKPAARLSDSKANASKAPKDTSKLIAEKSPPKQRPATKVTTTSTPTKAPISSSFTSSSVPTLSGPVQTTTPSNPAVVAPSVDSPVATPSTTSTSSPTTAAQVSSSSTATLSSTPSTSTPSTTMASNSEIPASSQSSVQKQLFSSYVYANAPRNTPDVITIDTQSDGTIWFNPDQTVNQARIVQYAQLLARRNQQYVCIDIEDPGFDIRKSSQATVTAHVNQMIQIVQALKQGDPGIQVGAYAFPFSDYYGLSLYAEATQVRQGATLQDPHAAYWANGGYDQALTYYHELQRANDAVQPLLKVLDFAAPDLYTHVDLSVPGNMQDWTLYAAAAIQEARRVMPGKTVLPFLQPQYTPELKGIAGKDIPTEYWRQEMKTVWSNADGAIIWGGWNSTGQEMWNPNAGWFSVVLDGSYKY